MIIYRADHDIFTRHSRLVRSIISIAACIKALTKNQRFEKCLKHENECKYHNKPENFFGGSIWTQSLLIQDFFGLFKTPRLVLTWFRDLIYKGPWEVHSAALWSMSTPKRTIIPQKKNLANLRAPFCRQISFFHLVNKTTWASLLHEVARIHLSFRLTYRTTSISAYVYF